MLKASVDLLQLLWLYDRLLHTCLDSYPERKRPPLDILKFLVTTLRNQDLKVSFIRVDEDGELARSSEFMKTCHSMNIIVQTTGGYAYYLNDKSESHNKTLSNITRDLLLNSSHKK